LNVPLVTGGQFVLGEKPAAKFDLVVVYRGLHCPICAKYLIELETLTPEFHKLCVNVVALSSDNAERAQAMAEKIKATPAAEQKEGTSAAAEPVTVAEAASVQTTVSVAVAMLVVMRAVLSAPTRLVVAATKMMSAATLARYLKLLLS
jgi:peroxiredoxin